MNQTTGQSVIILHKRSFYMNIHTNFKDYVYAQNTVMDMGADGALYFEPDSVSGGNNPPGDGEILLLYPLTGLFVIILISGGFKIKPDGISRSFGYTSPDTSVGVIARILPWTAVLLFSIVTITLNENINYLSAGNLAGLTTVFVVANAFFAILLFRGSFTVET